MDTPGRFIFDSREHSLIFQTEALPQLLAAMRLVPPADSRRILSAHQEKAAEIPQSFRPWLTPAIAAWFLRRGLAPDALALAEQIHGKQIARADRPGFYPGVDGLWSAQRGVGLVIRTADCVPVLMFSTRPAVIGLAHAGWRGVAAGIVPELARTLCRQFNLQPHRLQVALFPYIRACCYRVGRELEPYFPPAAWQHRQDGFYLDLGIAIRAQLMETGVPARNVAESGFCTSCSTLPLYSYRKSGTGHRLFTLAVLH
ncbi:MAG: laccase domain-containing protein [Calditrichaeota bacterium]|nr:MAG: laccase domain-containing protein [Calditrichota bacterium]